MTIKTVVQVFHDNSTPFYELGQLYARMFKQEARVRVVHVYLSGDSKNISTLANEEHFFSLSKKQLRGSKLKAIFQLRKIIKKESPALVMGSRYKALYVSLLATIGLSIPAVGIFHAYGVLRRISRRLFLSLFLGRLYLLGVSNAICDDIISSAPSVKNRTYCLYNCIDENDLTNSFLSRDEARSQLNIDEDAYVFANVGRLHPDKGQDLLIKAFAKIKEKMPSARLLLIGDGRCEDSYRQLVSDLGVSNSVIIFGYLSSASKYFRAFDVYVSASNKEPFGMVLTEAQCACLPIIAADCGGAKEVVNASGLLFDRNNAAQLSELMLYIYQKSDGEKLALAENGRLRQRDNFSFSSFCTAIKKLPFWPLLDNDE